MKKFSYSKISFVIQLFFAVISVLVLIFVQNKFKNDDNTIKMVILIALLGSYLPFIVSVCKRTIVLTPEMINFYSFFNSIYTPKKKRDFFVRYSDITSIEAKKSIIPKRMSIKIKTRNRSNPIFIEYNMVDHKELFKSICESVQISNPEAYIDKQILRYTQLKDGSSS